MSCFRLSRTLKKNWFLDVVPTQSVQRSCSIDKERRVGEIFAAPVGAVRGIETLTAEAMVTKVRKPKNRGDAWKEDIFSLLNRCIELEGLLKCRIRSCVIAEKMPSWVQRSNTGIVMGMLIIVQCRKGSGQEVVKRVKYPGPSRKASML